MIYRVVLDDLYDLHTSDIDCMLLNPSLELEMNSAGSFNFTLPPKHPSWNRIEILKSTIDVYEDDDLIFTGRVANIDKNWNNERVVECEGALAYFNDSIHRQMKWETPLPIAVDPENQPEDPSEHIQNFLEDILNNHNVFVGDAVNRQIHVGHIYIDPYLVTREVDYDTTLDILTRMCIDTNGGYFMIRKDPETHLLYLDWLKDFTEESGQPASFGVNLLDFNTGLHAADICTGVLARGATVNDQVVTLSNVELVDETTYPDMSVDHYTDHDQDILWHREGMDKFGRVVQVHEFPDAQTDWKNGGQVVANSLFEEARKWLEEKNTKIESIEVEVAELSWLQEGVPKYKLGQIVEILDDAHMAGEPYEVRRLPMYKLSCDLSSGSKKVTLGRPPKKELTQISASNSDSSTLSSGNSSGSSSGGGSGSGEECKVHDVRVDGTSVVSDKIANISLTGKADTSIVNALAATVATKADTATVNALADVVSGKQDQIEFNTQEAATEVLTRLKANDIVYNLGGGTEVEANPSESATDDLNTIKIGDTVYDIPGGGGSNTNYGKFKCDVLFDTPASTTSWNSPIEICDENVVKEYDMLNIMHYSNSSYPNQTVSNIILVKDIGDESNGNYNVFFRTNNNMSNIDGTIFATFNNGKLYVYTNPNKYIAVKKVYGLKFENKLINRSDIYSEEERLVGRWTNGKPVYQKTWIKVVPSAHDYDGGLAYLIDSDVSYIDEMISGNGYLKETTVGAVSILNGGIPNMDGWSYGIHVTGTKQLVLYGATRTTYVPGATAVITLQYTKTTDAPFSKQLIEDPQFVMMSDIYSEEEQVVGRWTDGKPVYQKTVIVSSGSLSSGTMTVPTTGITNVEKCIDWSCRLHSNSENRDFPIPYDRITYSESIQCLIHVLADHTIGCTLHSGDRSSYNNIGDICITFKYTKTTDAPGTGPTKGNLIYLPALYSEEEREVGVWTDGKPVYQKTWNVTLPNGSDGSVLTVNADVDTMVNIRVHGINDSDYYNANSSYGYAQFYYNKIQDIIYANTLYNWMYNDNVKLTLQYTKTTDQPGSGTWTPEGQLAHHYSTSEKVVGTWIDGSTVYERTWTGLSIATNTSWHSTGIDVSFANRIIGGTSIDSAGQVITESYAHPGYNDLLARSMFAGNTIATITLQYTKSS